ncbi:MAG: hypothetical protein GF400_01900 [Candidatus Eisenbacteria bacterium]|nr:hypothetical protein [Candidatus Eisenbacteria bacterium]
MRTAIALLVVSTVCCTAALAAPVDASKSAGEIMFPIRGPERALFEGFETSVPPAGWTLHQTNVNDTWTQDCGLNGEPYEGSCFADCQYDADYSGPQDERLCFDYTIEAGDECLCFYAFGSIYWAVDPYQNYNLVVEIDGVPVWDYRNDNDGAVTWQWQLYCVDLTGYGVGEDITVCFIYEGYDGAQGAFDAISIGECISEQQYCCPSATICDQLNFSANSGGAVGATCGAGPSPWEWGTCTGNPATDCDGAPISNEWCTEQSGNYPSQRGGAIVVGPFNITSGCVCLDLCHYYEIEFGYDGGNVKVSADGGTTWELVEPSAGYDDVLDSTSFIAECVADEPVFTGDSVQYVRDCFDLSAYEGEDILVGFFFGSDESNEYLGWYLRWVKLGSDSSPVESTSWGAIKAMYR